MVVPGPGAPGGDGIFNHSGGAVASLVHSLTVRGIACTAVEWWHRTVDPVSHTTERPPRWGNLAGRFLFKNSLPATFPRKIIQPSPTILLLRSLTQRVRSLLLLIRSSRQGRDTMPANFAKAAREWIGLVLFCL